MTDVLNYLKVLQKQTANEITGWTGMCITSIFTTATVMASPELLYGLLAGIGALSAGVSTAYYYVQKAKLISVEIEIVKEKIKTLKEGKQK